MYDYTLDNYGTFVNNGKWLVYTWSSSVSNCTFIVKFRVLDPVLVMHKDGREVENKGQMVLTRYFSMVPTENYDPDKSVKELAVAIKHPPEQDLEVENLDGKIVMIKVEYKAATVLTDAEKAQGKKAYGEGNDIKRVTPVPEDDQFTVPPF